MKISRIVLAVLFALAASANTLRAVPPSLPTFSFHENGDGKLELPLLCGGVIPLAGALMIDTGPGGLSSALTFTAHPLVNPFPEGDVVLLDASGHVSDILRFDPATSTSSGLTQLIFFYSNDHGGLLADTGLPYDCIATRSPFRRAVRSDHLYPNCRTARLHYRFPWETSFHIRHRTLARRS